MKIRDIIKARLANNAEDSKEKNLTVEEKSAVCLKLLAQDSPPSTVADDLPTYTATQNEINKWHSYGALTAQYLLKFYNFGYYDRAYNKLKIGYDVGNHAATFALDDSHVYKIPFDKYDAAPLDDSIADKVLQKIQELLD